MKKNIFCKLGWHKHVTDKPYWAKPFIKNGWNALVHPWHCARCGYKDEEIGVWEPGCVPGYMQDAA
jgi:predicted Zn-ribbon and HTH transcriptional regulator